MKAMFRFPITLLIALLLISSGLAQKKGDNDARTRALFVKKKADAMMVVLMKVEGATLVPISPSSEFKSGDQVKVQFQSNFNGYIYLVNVTPGGKKKVLFPQDSEANNIVQADKRYDFPPGQDVIEFDDQEKGTEVLQVIMSRSRIALLDDAIKNSDGELGESAESAAAELEGGISNSKVSSVLPEGEANGVRSRKITIAPGKDKNPQGSVVAIDDAASKSKLKEGDVATFELRLKHN